MLALFRPKTDAPWVRPEIKASWPEIILVGAVMIGPFAGRSIWNALQGLAPDYVQLVLSNSRLILTSAIESGMLALFFFFLARRGWTTLDFKIRPGLWSSLQGLALFLTTEAAHIVAAFSMLFLVYVLQTLHKEFLAFVMSQVPHIPAHGIQVSWGVLLGSMILNAYFEEMTCMGYFFTQIATKDGTLIALILTVFLRMLCHTYQGPVNVVSIGVIFTIYGLWYCRTRNLWPLIFAHTILDLFSTGMVKILFGH